MKHMKSLVLLLVPILLFSGCKKSIEESDIVGKIYTYEKDGFGGSFTIHIKDDGTFVYNEGLLSSYIGIGKWTLDEDILLLSDDGSSAYARENYFKVDGDDLLFMSENSTNFLYIKIADKERFTGG